MMDVVLGIIAFASLTTLVIEITVAVMIFRAGMRAKARVERVAAMTTELRTHAGAIASEFEKSVALAEKQIRRAEEAYVAVRTPLEPFITAYGMWRSITGLLDDRSRRR